MRIDANVIDYARHIYESVTTILVGMWITFKTAFFERKVTLQYPSFDVMQGRLKECENTNKRTFEPLLGAGQQYRGPLNPRVSERYRGLLGYDESKCITCLRCAKACPIDVITVQGVKIEGRKAKAPTVFTIHYARCMFCGLCVEACPTDAIFFTRRFEAATFDYGELIKHFISPAQRTRRLEQADELRQKKAAEKREKSQ